MIAQHINFMCISPASFQQIPIFQEFDNLQLYMEPFPVKTGLANMIPLSQRNNVQQAEDDQDNDNPEH